MIGALIGDLAAWTYEHDKTVFYKELIANNGIDAELSVYGKALLNAASHNLMLCSQMTMELEGAAYEDSDKYFGQWLMWQIVLAWKDDDSLSVPPNSEYIEKEEGYARLFMFELIRSLRKGATKSEAYYSANLFEDLSKSWKWKTETSEKNIGLLTYIFRAWDSFYRAFDYTSTIHNAMKWPGDRHLTAAIAGAFADAMYGCGMSYIKQKYAKDGDICHFLEIHGVAEKNGYHHDLIHKMAKYGNEHRAFYAKNNALTNVELYNWQPIKDIFEDVSLSDDDYRKILRSAPTDWDCRYGMYLDDGWIYVYRSHRLIGRFQLKKLEEQWFIENPQLSEERSFKDFCIALGCAINEGCKLILPELFRTIRSVEVCKYFNGEIDVPSAWKHRIEGNFWHGEMMFCKTHASIEQWQKKGEKLKKKLKGDRLAFAKRLNPEQFGIALYIENLFAQWQPYDSLDWIIKYGEGLSVDAS